jgi:hypothetical protein
MAPQSSVQTLNKIIYRLQNRLEGGLRHKYRGQLA